MKFTCPSCYRPSISLRDKFWATRRGPTRCAYCGSYLALLVERNLALLLLIPVLVAPMLIKAAPKMAQLIVFASLGAIALQRLAAPLGVVAAPKRSRFNAVVWIAVGVIAIAATVAVWRWHG